ncbi:MAG: HAD-IIB family hydrolase [Opitutales bacterium]
MEPAKDPVRLFATDLDGTILGKPDAAAAFQLNWSGLPDERRPLLCYNTGRLLDDVLNLVKAKQLPEPDYIIAGVGTTIYDFRNRKQVKAFSEVLEEGWDRERAEAVIRETTKARPQPAHFQTPYKTSWYLENADEETLQNLEQALEAAGLEINIVYSSNIDLDVLPKFANKGNALSWLLKHLRIPRGETLVAGDTGNDSAMFRKRGVRGIVVGNAQPELLEMTVALPVYQAEGNCADGVMEGLQYFGVFQSVQWPEVDHDTLVEMQDEPAMQHLVEEESPEHLSDEQMAFIREGYQAAIEGLRKNITPRGFSACSLSDNETRGTDVNYRSVWARDGAITTIASLGLKDPDLTACGKDTLLTLLDHMSPTGQIPANVSLDSGEPDYSGVGGICSIDSGLWVIIAIHDYVRTTGDVKFLRDNRDRLQAAMNWLSAHDSNNDALLEVPEAGDWTDLFGRSYHVLYDEVLWYQTNICWGRLLEELGDWQKAGDYLRWAGIIKRTILEKFWPTVSDDIERPPHFAEMQHTLGDTSYLIAQITPFSFDWRCDIFGNCLAFLYNILDINRAQIAFRFMWGVGVNAPAPVANLYPVVTAGDPAWRSYYTVNLLNLPHHYHNGGIWPLVGGQWVRFINRIGLRDIALQELYRLAQINRAGLVHDWEFNEWAHGTTGKPMGKMFQAWSCASYIQACQELRIPVNSKS